MRSLRYRQVIQSFFFVHSINLCQHVTSLLECLQLNLSDMFVSLPVLPHPLKANKQDEMRWLNFCVLWLEKALVKDCVVINRLNINTINPHHHHARDHQVAKLQKKSAVLSSAPDDDYEAGRSNFGKNNLVTTITIKGRLSIESRSNYGAIDDHLHWQGYNQPDCTGSIKSLSKLLWRRGGPWGTVWLKTIWRPDLLDPLLVRSSQRKIRRLCLTSRWYICMPWLPTAYNCTICMIYCLGCISPM